MLIRRVSLLGAVVFSLAVADPGPVRGQTSEAAPQPPAGLQPSCKKIRREINLLVNGGPVIKTHLATGERRLLAPEEREEALKKARKIYASRCDPQRRGQDEQAER
jgi:hypothetical protein